MPSSKTLAVNPWLSMWTEPTKTIRQIVAANPARQLLLVSVLGGVATMLNRAMNRPVGDLLPLSTILAAVLLMGAVVGIAKVYVYAWLLQRTGRYVGGKGTQPELRAAVAWSAVPLIWGLILWIPAIALYGREWFSATQPAMAQNPMLPLLFILVSLVLSLWSLILTLRTIAEVQRVTLWKAALNGLLAGVIIAVITLVLGFLFGIAFFHGVKTGM
jgi:hypothetical protein